MFFQFFIVLVKEILARSDVFELVVVVVVAVCQPLGFGKFFRRQTLNFFRAWKGKKRRERRKKKEKKIMVSLFLIRTFATCSKGLAYAEKVTLKYLSARP